MTTRFGEVTHSSWAIARHKPMIEREYGFHFSLLESNDETPDIYDFFEQIKEGKSELICNVGDTVISYLFGEDNSNDVVFCIPEEIDFDALTEKYDVISISENFLKYSRQTLGQ